MRSTLRQSAALALTLVAALGLAGCGGGDVEDAGGDQDQAAIPTGGDAVVNYTSFPDYLDPALSYTVEGWNTLSTVYNGLLSYNRAEDAEGAELVPALASEMPEVSDDGLTYRFQLRDGLQYSDGTDVKASDFEHAIKRVLNLQSGGSAFYLDIEGADQYFERDRAKGDISGIETDDETGEITIRLSEPNGSFPFILALPFASLVPGGTDFENLTTNPPPGVGAFKLEDVRQGRGYTLVRNENFPEIDGVPAPKLDSVRVDIATNKTRQTQDIIRNEVDWSIDPPPADQLRTVKSEYAERYEEYVTNSTYYFFMNHDVAPFDDVRVRQAVNYAIDKRALSRLFGGLLEPGCNYLPPGMPGYEKIDPCPYGDPTAAPQIDRARELIAEAGVEGDDVTVWGYDEDPSRPVTEYLTDVLNEIGFEAEPQLVEASTYFQTVGNQRTDAQIGFTNWHQDFPHPQNFMFHVDPDSIQSANNPNLGYIRDQELDRILDEADHLPIEESADMYANVDRMLLEEAHIAPYGHRKLANFVSERVDFENCTVTHPVYSLDLTQLCVNEAR